MANNNVDLNLKVNMKSNVNKELKSLESSVIRTVGAITAALATIQAALFPVTNAIAFERAMADVAKTTGYSAAQIDTLSESLNDMSKVLAISAVDLANVAAIAGQLGLGDQGREAIEQFTASVARASITLGLSVEKTAEGGAQLSAIFGKSVSEVERVFATINELSNNSVAAGGDLIDIMKRVGTTAGAGFEQVAALAATVRQLGVPNEQAGTGLVKYLGNLLAESQKFADAMQLSQEDWVDKVKDNSVEALQFVLQRLSELGAAQQSELIKKLFGSGRLFALGDKLVGDAENNFQVMNDMISRSTAEYKEGTSSIIEYNRIMETTAKRLDILKESFISLGIKAGNQVLPAISRLADKISENLQDKEVIDYFENLGVAMGRFVDDLSKAGSSINEFVESWENVIVAIKVFIGYKIGQVLAGWLVKLALVVVAFKTILAQITIMNALLQDTANKYARVATLATSTGTAMAASNLAAGAATAAASLGRLSKVMLVLRGVATALMGPAGLLILLGVATIAYWKTEILDFIGWSDAASRKEERKRNATAKENSKRLSRQISQAEESLTQVGAVLASIPSSIMVRIQLNTEDAARAIKELIELTLGLEQNLDLSVKGVVASEEKVASLTEEMNTLLDQTKKLREEQDAIEQGANRVTGSGNLDEIQARDDAKRIEEIKARTEELNHAIAGISKQIDGLENRATAFADSSDKINDKILGNTKALAESFDTVTKAYVNAVAESKRVAEGIAELRALQKQYQADQAGVDQEDRYKPEANARRDALNILEERIKEAEATDKVLQDSVKNLFGKLSGEQQKLVASVEGYDLTNVERLADSLNRIKLNDTDKGTQAILEGKEALLLQYNVLKDVAAGYGRMSAAAEDYRKRAVSSLSNVNNEIAAMRNAMAQFGRDIRVQLVDRKIDLSVNVETDKIDEEYQKAKDKINKFYDGLEEQSKNSSAFSVFSSTKGREAELEELELQRDRDKAALESKAAIDKYNNALERSASLAKEANAAAQEGNLEKFLALKNSSKQSLQDARDFIEDMKSIQTTNVFGEETFKFNDADIIGMFDKVADVGGGIEENLRKGATTMSDEATKSAKIAAKLYQDAQEALKGPENQVALIREIKGGSAFINAASENYRNSINGLTKVLGAFESQSFTPFDSLGSFDSEAFQKEVESALTPAVYESFKEGLSQASSDFEYKNANKDAPEISVPTAAQIQEELLKAELKVNPEVDTTKIEDEVNNKPYKLNDVTATIDADKDISIINAKKLKIQLDAIIAGGGTSDGFSDGPAFQLGGPVSGAGTSTSDSIPAWLSNGEWVIDAVTTKFFGGSFFAGLQSMARGGRKPSTKGGLPAFAGGGSVGGAESVGSITLNLGGKGYTLYGERQQAKELVNLFKKMDRG